jgi:hypothetical protein
MDELKIKKAAEGNINIDADIRNADWVKRTFDFPEVTTAKKYREEFGLEDDEALDEHIKEWKGTPYWEGIPSKIKTALLKARLSKHLGSQHDQMTHGRRKTAVAPLEDLGGGDFRVRYGSYDRTINMMGEVAKLAGYTDEGLGIEALYEDYPQLRNFDDAMDWTAELIVDQKWVFHQHQAVMRTIASSMMGLEHYPSNGDEVFVDEYGDEDIMTDVYYGTGPDELVDPYIMWTASTLYSSVNAEPSEREWHRGMVVTTKSPILRMAEGDRFTMPPSSFGGRREVAETFIRGGMFEPTSEMLEAADASVYRLEWRDVILKLEAGAKGVQSTQEVKDLSGRVDPFEMVVNGEFEVVSVDSPFYDYEGADDETVEITIRQVSTFDPRTGEFVEVG